MHAAIRTNTGRRLGAAVFAAAVILPAWAGAAGASTTARTEPAQAHTAYDLASNADDAAAYDAGYIAALYVQACKETALFPWKCTE